MNLSLIKMRNEAAIAKILQSQGLTIIVTVHLVAQGMRSTLYIHLENMGFFFLASLCGLAPWLGLALSSLPERERDHAGLCRFLQSRFLSFFNLERQEIICFL